MDAEQAAAGMLCVSFRGTSPTADILDLIDRGIRGICLFAYNVESRSQVRDLCARLKEHARRPLLIAVDHEGGRVQRLREGFTAIPTAREIAQRGTEFALSTACTIGKELRSVNVDMNFAPVVDVDTNPANPVIGARSFSSAPNIVAVMGCAMILGMQANGVAACAKHFPGHGDTSTDSHLTLPRLDHAMDRIERIELPRFLSAIRADVAAVMVAHMLVPAIDPNMPTSMSKASIDGILRRKWGFDRVVVTDALEMKAIADHFGVENAVVRSAQAGVDLLLHCDPSEDAQHKTLEALTKSIARGVVTQDRVKEAHRRLDVLCEAFVKSTVSAA